MDAVKRWGEAVEAGVGGRGGDDSGDDVPDPVGGESVAAAVRLAPGASATSETLRAWCRERLRREAVPEHWFFVQQMPRNARGKLSRDAVRRTVTSGAA